jgi:hypothetical protein
MKPPLRLSLPLLSLKFLPRNQDRCVRRGRIRPGRRTFLAPLFVIFLREAAQGCRQEKPRAMPRREGCCCTVVQGLTHFLPRTSRDWRAGKCLSGGAGCPLDICRASWFCFFSPVPHYVDHQNVNSFTLCCGKPQLLLWKVGASRVQTVPKTPRPDSHAHMRLDVQLGFTRSCRSMYAAVGNQQIPWPSSTPLRSGRSRNLAVLLRQATSLLSFRHVNNSVLKRPSLQASAKWL